MQLLALKAALGRRISEETLKADFLAAVDAPIKRPFVYAASGGVDIANFNDVPIDGSEIDMSQQVGDGGISRVSRISIDQFRILLTVARLEFIAHLVEQSAIILVERLLEP